MSDALSRLAAHFGIANEFADIWGHVHPTSDDTRRALLGAMGVDADEAHAEAAWHRVEDERWAQVLPPVTVFRPGVAREVRIQLDPALGGTDVAWQIQEENGAQHEGLFRPAPEGALERRDAPSGARTAWSMPLEVALPEGYHRLTLSRDGALLGQCSLIVAPGACYEPASIAAGGRVFGPAVQLYSVRSRRNWGIGDFGDLATIVEQWAAQGSNVVGVNPLHALFPHDPTRASPYSPSSRLFLDTLYLDVEAIPEFAECEPARVLVRSRAFQSRLERLRATDEVDYAGVAAAKREVLALLAQHFREQHLARNTARAAAFRTFVVQGGDALERLAAFEALQEELHRRDTNVWGWPAWPQEYHDPDGAAVRVFVAEHRPAIDHALYLQWQADAQLATVFEHVKQLGMDVGLYRDLAVSIDPGGAEAWANRSAYAVGASVGAPPDAFSPQGQNWGLPPLAPHALRAHAYAPFIATLRANMRHAGALRIDHVMGLARLYWIAEGGKASEGAYVRYPLADLMAVLALESQRQRCLIIGEDLGTVPDDVRNALRDAKVLSYRLLWFERDHEGRFLSPARYPAQALVSASTHDLPTIAGWWEGRDIDAREARHLFADADAARREREQRAHDRQRLLEALAHAGLPAPGWHWGAEVAMSPELARRMQQFLARTPAQLMVVQLEDVIGALDQRNLPGTTAAYPNWRLKLSLPLERWMDDERFDSLTRMLRRTRRGPTERERAARHVQARVPRATYRLQLHREFTLRDATALVPYLAALGVSHVYCSPYLRARPGSRHGYDIVDHAALNPEIGDAADLDQFVATLARHGMAHILDVVPNHMGVMGSDNAWWMDVLENGPASLYADHFDIDWTPRDPDLGARLLVPILGDHYGNVLERGEVRVVFEPASGAFAARYYEHRLPLDPRSYRPLLERARVAAGKLPPSAATRLASVMAGLDSLPARFSTPAARIPARHEAKEALKAQLAKLADENPTLRQGIETALAEFNGPGEHATSMAALHMLLEAQAFRLAYWRVAADDINYRRFFDINDLAGLRAENEAVFQATHRLVLTLTAAGKVDGLRIDHPDGLHDPARYFERLQESYVQATGLPAEAAKERPLYVVVEKILAVHEELPLTWCVHGTTGYRFANLVTGLFVDASAKTRVDRAWRVFVREEAVDFETAVIAGKRAVMQSTLAAELSVLTHRLLTIARADLHTRDFTYNVLREALMEVTAEFPVYRTYVADRVSTNDRRYIEWAIARGRRRSRAADVSVFDFLRNVLLVRPPASAGEALRGAFRAFALRFQQFTAPVTAKGIEDTALYVFNRLVSLNEVGGDPDRFGTSVSAFHAANADRATRWPHTLIASSTHDNKRSEDVRARIDLISEMPGAWRLLVRRWSGMNRSRKRTLEGRPAPSRNDEYLLYQTLVGSVPEGPLDDDGLGDYRERIKAYAVKAAREAKVSTSWINVNTDYEAALTGFVEGLLAPGERNLFLEDLKAQRAFFSWFGALNSVGMTALKVTAPGVPDIYQGNETLDFSLVDPDNRRPVDYELRRRNLAALQEIAAMPPGERGTRVRALFDEYANGQPKLWVTWNALRLRAERKALFRDGAYVALRARGEHAAHVVAFARTHEHDCCIVVCGRLFAGLMREPGALPVGDDVWRDTAIALESLPRGNYVERLTGAPVHVDGDAQRIGSVLRHFPVALLERERS